MNTERERTLQQLLSHQRLLANNYESEGKLETQRAINKIIESIAKGDK